MGAESCQTKLVITDSAPASHSLRSSTPIVAVADSRYEGDGYEISICHEDLRHLHRIWEWYDRERVQLAEQTGVPPPLGHSAAYRNRVTQWQIKPVWTGDADQKAKSTDSTTGERAERIVSESLKRTFRLRVCPDWREE
jgi:hypothetical protein